MTILKPFRGRVLRVVRLDACGAALTGAQPGASTGTVTSDGFIKIDFTPEYDAGVEYIQKNANGDLCVNEKDADRLKRMGVKISLCAVDPAAIEIMTGNRVITSAGQQIGGAFDETPSDGNFALEVWSSLAGAACATSGVPTTFMWLIPWVQNMKVNAISIDNTPITLELEGNSKANPNYGAGRAGLWSPVLGPLEHWAYQSTATAPPTPVAGYTATT